MGYAIGDDKEVINADEFSFKSQECLLIYPFLGTVNVKKASFGLPLCDTGDDFTCLQVITNQLEKTVGRNHIQTITQLDHDSLLPKINVNYVLSIFGCHGCHATVYAMNLPNTFLHHNSTPNLWKERGVYAMCQDG